MAKTREKTSYGIRKKIDRLGRMSLPKVYRDVLGIDILDEVEICLVDGGILIRKVDDYED